MASSAAAAEKWEEIDEELKFNKNEKLGSGGFGTVYRGKYVLPSNNSSFLRNFGGRKIIDVAVKIVDKRYVKFEDEILGRVRNHPNVLNFYCDKERLGLR